MTNPRIYEQKVELPEPDKWISRCVFTDKERIDKLKIQSLQPGRYQYKESFSASQYTKGVQEAMARALEAAEKAVAFKGSYSDSEEYDAGFNAAISIVFDEIRNLIGRIE